MTNHIIDVTETDFQYEVLQYSRQTPVVVDFWAEWCQPCKLLSPILEKLANQANGSFRLAKVDVDANPNLSIRYNIRSIPSVKGFLNGDIVSEFVGLLPEPKIRQFLKELVPSSADLFLEKADSMMLIQNWKEAEENYRKALINNQSPAVLLGLAKSLLAQNKITEAQSILVDFPPSREFTVAEQLQQLSLVLATEDKVATLDNPIDMTYQRTLMLIRKGNLLAAMDGLLEVLREDKNFKNDEPRKILIALMEILGSNSEISRQYRQEMATILF